MGKEGDSSRGQGLCRVPEEASLGSSPLCDARIRQDWQRLTPVRAGGTWQQLAAGGAPGLGGPSSGRVLHTQRSHFRPADAALRVFIKPPEGRDSRLSSAGPQCLAHSGCFIDERVRG